MRCFMEDVIQFQFFFFFLNLDKVLIIQFQENSATLEKTDFEME